MPLIVAMCDADTRYLVFADIWQKLKNKTSFVPFGKRLFTIWSTFESLYGVLFSSTDRGVLCSSADREKKKHRLVTIWSTFESLYGFLYREIL